MHFYKLAHKIAFTGRNRHHRMGCYVVRGGSVLSKASNHDWNHAEEVALRKHGDYRGAKLYIARTNHRISKPCPACMTKIKAAGIVAIIYVNKDQKLQRDKISAE